MSIKLRLIGRSVWLTVIVAALVADMADATDISFSASANDVSFHEPVIARVQIINRENIPIEVNLGKDRETNFVVSFNGPNGQARKNIRLSWEGIGAGGAVTTASGATYQQSLLLNEWVPFDRTGKYHVTLALENFLPPEQHTPNNTAVAELDINIEPFDSRRLQNVCASLEQAIQSTDNVESILQSTRALSVIVDETAVPYLGRSLNKGFVTAPIVIPTLEKIGSRAAARVLIKSLNELPAEYPALARNALLRIKAQTADASLKVEIQKALQTTS
jgi:hypothetical protein